MHEAHVIAGHLAASTRFPIPVDGVRDSCAHVEADGNTVTICVTDHDGTKREYQAQVVLVSDSRTAPEPQVRQHLAETAHTHQPSTESR